MSDFAEDTNVHTNDCISRQAAIYAVEKESQVDGSYGYMDTKSIVDLLSDLPSAEPKKEDPWSAIRTMLNELERKQEKLYADYCDATARLKAINKIAESSQAPRQKVDGIKPLAELGETE